MVTCRPTRSSLPTRSDPAACRSPAHHFRRRCTRPDEWDDMWRHPEGRRTDPRQRVPTIWCIPPMFRMRRPRLHRVPELTAEQWTPSAPAPTSWARSSWRSYDVRLCLHPHADSHIQTQPEIERYLNSSDSRYANLCLDTGTCAYGGGDNLT